METWENKETILQDEKNGTTNTTFGDLTKFHGPADFGEGKVGDGRNALRGLVNFYDRKLDERISEGKVWAEGLANGDGEIRDAT